MQQLYMIETLSIYNHPPSVGIIYPIATYIPLTHTPQIVGSLYLIQRLFFKNVHYPTQYIQSQHIYSTHTYPPNCWQLISNTKIISESYITQFMKLTHRWRCKQIGIPAFKLPTEWQITYKTRHEMALLTYLNHILLKVNHYFKKKLPRMIPLHK